MLLAKIPQPIKCVHVDYGFTILDNKAQSHLCFFLHEIPSRSFLAKE